MKANGTGLRKVAQVPGYKEHSLPVWSHDGTWLAFDAMHEATRAKKVFVVERDGSGLKTVCDGDSPDWSPDDKQIAYHTEGVLNTPQGIYVQNLDGKGRSRIVDADGPRWSPDGGLLATTDGRSLSVLDLISGEGAATSWPDRSSK